MALRFQMKASEYDNKHFSKGACDMKLRSLVMPIALALVGGAMAQTAPGAPTNVRAVAWPNGALVYFDPPANNGGASITSYYASVVNQGWLNGTMTHSPFFVGLNTDGVPGSPLSFTVTATNSAGTGPASAASNAVTPTGWPSGTDPYWVYKDGVFSFVGTFDYGLKSDFADTTGVPLTGQYDIVCREPASGGTGGIQPICPGNPAAVPLSKYKYVTVCLKPTHAGQNWNIGFAKTGDVFVGNRPNLAPTYGPAPVVGKWACYNLPLTDAGVPNDTIYKFSVNDLLGGANNAFYIDNLGFCSTPQTLTSAVNQSQTNAVAPVSRAMSFALNARTIDFQLGHAGTLTVHDLLGNRLAVQHAGYAGTSLSWTVKSSGVYFAEFEQGGISETARILVK